MRMYNKCINIKSYIRPQENKLENMVTDCSDAESSEDESKCGYYGEKSRKSGVAARPTSAGYWLCCLLPLAFASHYLHKSDNNCTTPTYSMLTIAAGGMCIESLCFFMYMFLETSLLLKLIISFIPGLLTTILYMNLLHESWIIGIFWGFAVTFCYQNAYICVMRGLPQCFSYGEATVIVQGLMLFILNTMLRLPTMLLLPVHGEFDKLNGIMMSALFWLLVVCWLLTTFKWTRKTTCFYFLMILLMIAVTCIPVTKPLPIVTLFDFILSDKKRIVIILFYLILVVFTIATVCWQLRNIEKASTSVRKTFHFLIVLVYVPGIIYQCSFLYIASGVALAIFTVLELFRIFEIPPLAVFLKKAFFAYSDEKDAGMLAITPFCLLIGCSFPIWISPCPCSLPNENAGRALLPLFAGVLAIGCGDTAASIIGSKFGRIKWRDSSRSIEGTIAYIVAVMVAILCFNLAKYISMSYSSWIITVAATFITALIEAHTDQIDNLVLPLVFYIIVSFC